MTPDEIRAKDMRATAARYRVIARDAVNPEAASAHKRMADMLETRATELDGKVQ